MRRILTRVLGTFLAIVGVAVLIAGGRGMFHGRLPPDTLPKNEAQAEDLAYSVASNAGCGDFDSEVAGADPHTWQFSCSIDGVWYNIFAYDGDATRSADLARLQSDGRPYVARAYYAVTVPPQGVGKDDLLAATPPPGSIMDPFR